MPAGPFPLFGFFLFPHRPSRRIICNPFRDIIFDRSYTLLSLQSFLFFTVRQMTFTTHIYIKRLYGFPAGIFLTHRSHTLLRPHTLSHIYPQSSLLMTDHIYPRHLPLLSKPNSSSLLFRSKFLRSYYHHVPSPFPSSCLGNSHSS